MCTYVPIFKAFESLSSVWNEYVASEAETWVAFMKFWLNVKLVQKYPCQFIRYEDLVAGNSVSSRSPRDSNHTSYSPRFRIQDSFQNLTEFLLQGRPPIGVSPKRESKSFFRLKSGYRPRPKVNFYWEFVRFIVFFHGFRSFRAKGSLHYNTSLRSKLNSFKKLRKM